MSKITGSLKGAMTFNFIVAVALPILVISIITVTLLSRSMGEQVVRHNIHLARSLIASTEDFLATAGMVMQEAALMLETGGLDNRQRQYYLETLVASHSYFETIHVLNSKGQSVMVAPYHASYATLDMSRQPFFQITQQADSTYWSATFISQHTGQPTLTVTKPMAGGMLVGYVNLSKLNEIVAKNDTNIKGSWAAILDHEGTFIGHSDRSQVYQRSNIGDREIINDALACEDGTIHVKYGQQEYLLTAGMVKPTGWPLIVIQQTEVAFAPVHRTRNIFVIGAALALMLAGILAMLNLKKIFKPLNEFTADARQVASGNYDLPFKAYEYTEFTALSEHVHAMTEAVRRREAELTRYAQTLERSNRELDQFAYVVSHDLKAPLRAIDNLSQWIAEDLAGTLDADIRHKLELLRGRVQRMANLIEDILEYSRIGRVKTDIKPVNVQHLLAEVIEEVALPDGFHILIGPDMPVIKTERIRLKQVFANLIGNAVNHHNRPDGQIVVTVARTDGGFAFSVADNGPGIAPEYHRKIFEMFQTLQPCATLKNTGIGLALVKKIVENQGGQIELLSAAGQGAKFIFTWPERLEEE